LWDEWRASTYQEDSFHNFLFYAHHRTGLHPVQQEMVNDCFNDLSELVYGTRPYPPRGLGPISDEPRSGA
jgi:hypothetical protein